MDCSERRFSKEGNLDGLLIIKRTVQFFRRICLTTCKPLAWLKTIHFRPGFFDTLYFVRDVFEKILKHVILGAEDPPLGIMLSILKTTSQNFGLAIQDQISIKHKLENIEGLPTLELDFLSTDGQDGSTVEPTERPNLHQKQQIAKNALEKKYKVRFFFQKFRNFKGRDASGNEHNRPPEP